MADPYRWLLQSALTERCIPMEKNEEKKKNKSNNLLQWIDFCGFYF